MQPRQPLGPQNSTGKQVVELNGYVIILVESRDGKIKLYGSPADKDNLEVGDEILDVNERKLEDLPRAEVIRYIHECIQSCVIKLRVKRRSDARLAGELGNAVQDAFVIAVEQQARERLQRLSALKRITPVDMSQLSIKLNQQSQTKGATTQDYSFLKEASPIYVTSLTGNHVTGSTTTTTGCITSNLATTNCLTASNNQQQNNNQHTSSTATPPVSSGAVPPVLQLQAPPVGNKAQQLLAFGGNNPQLITHQDHHNKNHTVAAAGGNLSASAAASASSSLLAATSSVSSHVNLNNNNNSNITSNSGATGGGGVGGGTVSAAQLQPSFAKFYGNCNSSDTTTVIANGHGPKRELSTLSEGDSEPTEEKYEQKSISAAKQGLPLSSGGTEVLLGDQSLRQDNRPRRRSGSSIVVLGGEDTKKSRLPGVDDYMGHCDYQGGLAGDHNTTTTTTTTNPNTNKQQMQPTGGVDLEMLTMLSASQQDNGPYHEMAVDVPESFIARNKTPPRYPPPRPPNQVNHIPNGAMPQVAGVTTKSLITLNGGSSNGGSDAGSLGGGISLELQPLDTFDHHLHHIISPTASVNVHRGNGNGGHAPPLSHTTHHAAVASGAQQHQHHHHPQHQHNHHHSHHKSSPSLDSSNEFSKKSPSKAPSSLGSACESIGFDSMSYRTKSRGSVSTRSSSSGDLGPPEYDLGPHRELPVDVPDTFVEMKKAPPRYPPPKPQVIKELHKAPMAAPLSFELNGTPSAVPTPNGHLGSTPTIVDDTKQLPQPQAPVRNNELNGSVRPVPPPRDHLRIEKDGRLVNRAPAPQVPDRKQNLQQQTANNLIAHIVEPSNEQLDSIRKYQEQLRRRQEEQERIVQQNDFLRASLRGSRKLQALQDSPLQERPIGIENDAYAEDEELEVIYGYGDLVTAMQRLQNELNKQGMGALASRLTAAQQLLAGPNIARALAIRTAVLQRRRPRVHNPVCSNAQTMAKDFVESLAQSSSPAAIELCDLLSTYEMEGLLLAHDRIATTTDRSPATVVHAVPSDGLATKTVNQNANLVNNNNLIKQREPIATPVMTGGVLRGDNRDPIRIIQIEKSTEPLGATILNEGEAVVIGRIVRGGAAERSGLLHERDEILEVNGIEMSGKNVNDVCSLLGAMTGTLTFLIVPAGSSPPLGGISVGREPPVLHVRAHFDYDPEDDRYIPCRELGISFQKGDVLHVISRDDPNWWQSYREGEEDQTLAGLIPSQSFQHQREAMRLAAAGEAGLAGHRGGKGGAKGSTLLCVKKSGKGRKKKGKASSEAGYPLYATTTPDEPDPEEILTYEEVSLYYPRASHKRPIVLIGPPNIGRHELRQRLMADSDRFAAAVPHTSRQRREGEVSGQDYHFISRVQFEADILSRKFVEHGEYERAYYGTSLEAIRTVVSSGKICVLNLHPQSLKLLRASDLKPYVVLVAPPSLEKLRQKKVRTSEPVKDDDLKEIIATARDMEARWGHLFDMIIINNDTERAYHQLLAEINSLEREPQWVPASWVHN